MRGCFLSYWGGFPPPWGWGLDRLRRWGAVWLALGTLLVGAGAGPAWAGAPPVGADGSSADQLLSPPESLGLKLWGTVLSVESATLIRVVPQDGAPFQVLLYGVEPPVSPSPAMPDQGQHGQPYGQDAFTYVRDLLTGRQVQLESFGKDRRGRILAVVWLGDINVNLSLVKEGLAWVSPRVSNSRVRAELEVAERQAQKGKYGLWSLPNPEPPWVYRKRLRVPAA
jgi:micrococcal nuclease